MEGGVSVKRWVFSVFSCLVEADRMLAYRCLSVGCKVDRITRMIVTLVRITEEAYRLNKWSA